MSGLEILSVTLSADNTRATIETSTPMPDTIYRVKADPAAVVDVYNNPVANPDNAVVAMSITFQQGANGYSGTVDTHVRQDNPTTAYGTSATVLADNLSPLSHGLLRFENIFGNPGRTGAAGLGDHLGHLAFAHG